MFVLADLQSKYMAELTLISTSSLSGPPDPVGGCQIKNKTFTTISIGCRPGYNGGMKQYFVAILCPYNSFSSKILTFLQIHTHTYKCL